MLSYRRGARVGHIYLSRRHIAWLREGCVTPAFLSGIALAPAPFNYLSFFIASVLSDASCRRPGATTMKT